MPITSPQAHLSALEHIDTPAYVADMVALKKNMRVVDRIKQITGCKILLATKAFAQHSAFSAMIPHLDGTTASGYYEARLGAETFGKEVHVFSPAYKDADIEKILPYASHIYFNSIDQLRHFVPKVRKYHGKKSVVGLRINPHLSLTKVSALYDPSAPCSRFGIQPEELTPDIAAMIDLIHVHNLCENPAADSAALIDHIYEYFGNILSLPNIRYVNIGGGHYMNEPGYDTDTLTSAIIRLQRTTNTQVILEPGGALARNAGYIVASVVDIIRNDKNIALLDTSATCHMPDVLEVPYRPNIIGAKEDGQLPHTYMLTGNTCMTGDVIGTYSFATPLVAGDKLIFTCMAQYSLVKRTQFNGVPLPDIGILHENGAYERVASFGYERFKSALS